MPYLRFKGFGEEFVSSISRDVIREFSKLTLIPERKVKIELLQVKRMENAPRSVEILMFRREQALHDRIAACLFRMLKDRGHPDAHVFFVPLDPHLYYVDGRSME